MKTPNSASPLPNDKGDADDFEMVKFYIDDSPGDTTVRPLTPERIREREADRENIERFVAWAKRDQEKFNAECRAQQQAKHDMDFELGLDADDHQDLGKAS